MSTPLEKQLIEYLEYLELDRGRRQKTLQNYDHYLRRFFSWAKVGSPAAITEPVVRRYRLLLHRHQMPNGSTISVITHNYHLIALRGFLKYLAKVGIKSLPPEKIELPRVERRIVAFLEADEIERLFASVTENAKGLVALRDRAVLEMLFSTGLRVSELANLKKESVNLTRDSFTVRGKGGKPRIVFVSDEARNHLQRYLKARADGYDALFIAHDKRTAKSRDVTVDARLTPRSMQRIVRKYARLAGITKEVSPHTLRHSFATDLLQNGADIRSVQAMLGHESVTTTQIYTHVTNQGLRDVHKAFHGRWRGH